jgi:hypothetical protein
VILVLLLLALASVVLALEDALSQQLLQRLREMVRLIIDIFHPRARTLAHAHLPFYPKKDSLTTTHRLRHRSKPRMFPHTPEFWLKLTQTN